MQSLNLESGSTVLNLGCCSGLSFESIIDVIGAEGVVIGVGLERERIKARQSGWQNVQLLQRDVRQLTGEDIAAFLEPDDRINGIVCVPGFSVFPEWESVFDRTFDLLENGGRYAILDLYNEQQAFQTRIVNRFVNSDISRQVWKPSREQSEEYGKELHPGMQGETSIIASESNP